MVDVGAPLTSRQLATALRDHSVKDYVDRRTAGWLHLAADRLDPATDTRRAQRHHNHERNK